MRTNQSTLFMSMKLVRMSLQSDNTLLKGVTWIPLTRFLLQIAEHSPGMEGRVRCLDFLQKAEQTRHWQLSSAVALLLCLAFHPLHLFNLRGKRHFSLTHPPISVVFGCAQENGHNFNVSCAEIPWTLLGRINPSGGKACGSDIWSMSVFWWMWRQMCFVIGGASVRHHSYHLGGSRLAKTWTRSIFTSTVPFKFIFHSKSSKIKASAMAFWF